MIFIVITILISIIINLILLNVMYERDIDELTIKNTKLEEQNKNKRLDAIDEILKLKKIKHYDENNLIKYYSIKVDDIKNLKGKNKSCFDCKHHFMSDCFLYCKIHDNISVNCNDFEQL